MTGWAGRSCAACWGQGWGSPGPPGTSGVRAVAMLCNSPMFRWLLRSHFLDPSSEGQLGASASVVGSDLSTWGRSCPVDSADARGPPHKRFKASASGLLVFLRPRHHVAKLRVGSRGERSTPPWGGPVRSHDSGRVTGGRVQRQKQQSSVHTSPKGPRVSPRLWVQRPPRGRQGQAGQESCPREEVKMIQ